MAGLKHNFFSFSIVLVFTFNLIIQAKTNESINGSNLYIDSEIQNASIFTESNVSHMTTFQLFSHGKAGELFIAGKWMQKEEIVSFLKANINSNTQHINIYGCEFGKGTTGKNAVLYIQENLGISVSASDDITGKDGDWDLEVGESIDVLKFYGYKNNLQCAGIPGGRGDNDDFDKDGICNINDLDKDNDGILDSDEGCYQNLTFDWSKLAGLTATPNVPAQASLVIPTNNNGSLTVNVGLTADLNYTAIYGDGLAPFAGRDPQGGGGSGLTLYPNGISSTTQSNKATVSFTQAVYNLSFAVTDLDAGNSAGSAETLDIIGSYQGTVVVLKPSNITTVVGPLPTQTGNHFDGAGASNQGVFIVTYDQPIDKIEFVNGISANSVNSSNVITIFDFYFKVAIDADGDGIPNCLDTDSDGDGCPDAVEAGHLDANADGFLDGTGVDSSGKVTGYVTGYTGTKPAVTDPAINNACCDVSRSGFPDNDKDGISDSCDLDDDNDGISDVLECVCLSNAGTIKTNESLFSPSEIYTIPTNRFGIDSWSVEAHARDKSGLSANPSTIASLSTITHSSPASITDAAYLSDNSGIDNDWVFKFGSPKNVTGFAIWIPCSGNFGGGDGPIKKFNISGLFCDGTTFTQTVDLGLPSGQARIINFTKPFLQITSLTLDILEVWYQPNGDCSTIVPATAATIPFNYNVNLGEILFFDDGKIGNTLALTCDTDGDGIPNYLDTDSDNDGCPDALESTNTPYTWKDLNPNGSIKTTLYPIGTTPGSAGYGIPNSISYGLGSSEDAAVNACLCYKPGTGTAVTSMVGISTLNRQLNNAPTQWPENVHSGYLVLDSKEKGFVINRMTTTEINAIANKVKGMLVYDSTLDCLKLYDGTVWDCVYQTCIDK